MRTIIVLLLFYLINVCFNEAFLLQRKRDKSRFNPLEVARKPQTKRKHIPKYILRKFEENIKYGKRNNLHCIFPKVVRTKRAIKLVFKNQSFTRPEKNSYWKEDELRLFMTKTVKGLVARSGSSYLLKIFDLNSRKKVDVFKFSTKEFGWKTLNISAWRRSQPRKDSRGRFGMKITISVGKKKAHITETAFRKTRDKFNPYFIEYFQEKKNNLRYEDKRKEKGQHEKRNTLPDTRHKLPRRQYYLRFLTHDI